MKTRQHRITVGFTLMLPTSLYTLTPCELVNFLIRISFILCALFHYYYFQYSRDVMFNFFHPTVSSVYYVHFLSKSVFL